MSFKDAFLKKSREKSVKLQIKTDDDKTSNTVNQFKL